MTAAEAELAADENPSHRRRGAPDGVGGVGRAGRRALADDKAITAYAYARTGYHRGLDQLRRNGWKGFGPVPYCHEPNRGFLRCVAALAERPTRSARRERGQRCRICSTTATPPPGPGSG